MEKFFNILKWPFVQTKRFIYFFVIKPVKYFKKKKVFKVGLYVAALTFLFSISQNLSSRSELSFQFAGYAGGLVDEKSNPPNYQINHGGIIANRSQIKNTIMGIDLVVWADPDRKDKILAGGSGNTWIVDQNTGKEIKLPLVIEGKEAVKVNIFNKFPFEDVDKDLILAMKPTQPGSVFYIHKYEYELIFTDINGNEFSQKGTLINHDVIDLNWTLGNVCDGIHYKKWPCREEKVKIQYVKVVFSIRNAFHRFGLENVGNYFYEISIPRSWVIRP